MNKSDKLTKEEFEERLKENEFFSNPEAMINYRLPVVQYYLTNISNSTIIAEQNDNKSFISSQQIIINYKDEDFILVNQAFESIKQQLGL